MNTTTEETRQAAKDLLRRVPEVALDRKWITGQLLTGREEGRYSVNVRGHEVVRYVGREGVKTEAFCSDVTGCCVLGFVQLTAVCANGWDSSVTDEAERLLGDALVELGWAEAVLRGFYDKNTEERVEEGWPPLADYSDWRSEFLDRGDWFDLGEGLVAEWNDGYCENKDQVLELVAKAAA